MTSIFQNWDVLLNKPYNDSNLYNSIDELILVFSNFYFKFTDIFTDTYFHAEL